MFGSGKDAGSAGTGGFRHDPDDLSFETGIPVGPAPAKGRLESAPAADFAATARDAAREGDHEKAVHLYMLAFDAEAKMHDKPDARAIGYLHQAWESACECKDRALAEYVFGSLEPYCSSEEMAHCIEQLQRMALDKLEEVGLTRERIKEMAEMMAEDFTNPAELLKMLPDPDGRQNLGKQLMKAAGIEAHEPDEAKQQDEKHPFCYRDLVGYGRAIEAMRNRGIGLDDDPKFAEFLQMLSRRHGIHSAPSVETLLFSSYAREDASRFMAATVGELGMPVVRMFMEETPQGIPVLCVSASAEVHQRSHPGRGFEGPGVLVLEDIDMWGAPLASFADEYDEFSFAQLSRGAREAVMLIRSAVENPEVIVMASCADTVQLEDFFVDLLDPVDVVDIPVPDEVERAEVWQHVASMYPSLRYTDRADLVRLSANLSREDIYLAAREAVEQAYAESISKRVFVPVTRDNIFDKVAAYQPLDSREYRELEQAAVDSLRHELDSVDLSALEAATRRDRRQRPALREGGEGHGQRDDHEGRQASGRHPRQGGLFDEGPDGDDEPQEGGR